LKRETDEKKPVASAVRVIRMLTAAPLMWRKDYDARLIRHNTQKYISLCPRA
jgi:hypothetical protein